VTTALRTSWRLTSAAVVIGLLGACAVLVVFVDSPAGSGTARKPEHHPRHPVPPSSGAAMAPARRLSSAVRPVTSADRTGLRLLTEAVAACESVPFHGVQISAWFGSTQTVSVIQVWHRPGADLLVEPSRIASSSARDDQPSPADIAGQDEVLTIRPKLLALMRKNYLISYGGLSAVDGRSAQVVDVRHPNGTLAARFWIDTATKLPLRRELIAGGALLSEDAFLQISVGTDQPQDMPAADAHPWDGQLTAAGRRVLKHKGWPLPSTTVDGLSLFQSTQTSTKSGKVVELSYSDGLSVISVFVQPGELPRSLPGWRRFSAHGGSVVYAFDPDGRDLVWSAGGYVYTMISDAPASVVDQVVMHLPHDRPPGFWERMGRGFRRLVSWANPFR
jgi:sigma-E factor negative regulatory protein RseB